MSLFRYPRPSFTFCVLFPIAIGITFFISSCSVQKQIAKSADNDVLDAASLQTAHVGISIYEPATNKYWYDYQGDKYFIPASNTKIPTCYTAMKYLGDSLVGARVEEKWDGVSIYGTGDPTFFHPDFSYQPVLEYAKSKNGAKVYLIRNSDSSYNTRNTFTAYGLGWSWGDYDESYMPERSFFPIHGNVVSFTIDELNNLVVTPKYFRKSVWFIKKDTVTMKVIRDVEQNTFIVEGSAKSSRPVVMPFQTFDRFVGFLGDGKIYRTPDSLFSDIIGYPVIQADAGWQHKDYYKTIHSQPTDSLLKPMMHRSDNFFAEQSLLMVSNERIGIMNDEKVIDTILKTDLKDLPQKPRWVDGSGLSRYNLFTPKDFVFILDKMKNEFGMERVKIIFPTGGEGTLTNYYLADSNYIYAKTGTLSGVVAISGYLYTKKGKELIFSVLVNNHQASGTEVRRAVEKFLQAIRNKY